MTCIFFQKIKIKRKNTEINISTHHIQALPLLLVLLAEGNETLDVPARLGFTRFCFAAGTKYGFAGFDFFRGGASCDEPGSTPDDLASSAEYSNAAMGGATEPAAEISVTTWLRSLETSDGVVDEAAAAAAAAFDGSDVVTRVGETLGEGGLSATTARSVSAKTLLASR